MKAYELLDSPEKWTKGTNARDADGNRIDHRESDAVSFCVVGALARCYGYPGKAYDEAFDKLWDSLPDGVVEFNDDPSRTFEQVREALIRADV